MAEKSGVVPWASNEGRDSGTVLKAFQRKKRAKQAAINRRGEGRYLRQLESSTCHPLVVIIIYLAAVTAKSLKCAENRRSETSCCLSLTTVRRDCGKEYLLRKACLALWDSKAFFFFAFHGANLRLNFRKISPFDRRVESWVTVFILPFLVLFL